MCFVFFNALFCFIFCFLFDYLLCCFFLFGHFYLNRIQLHILKTKQNRPLGLQCLENPVWGTHTTPFPALSIRPCTPHPLQLPEETPPPSPGCCLASCHGSTSKQGTKAAENGATGWGGGSQGSPPSPAAP